VILALLVPATAATGVVLRAAAEPQRD
jgi:hypothetical protein